MRKKRCYRDTDNKRKNAWNEDFEYVDVHEIQYNNIDTISECIRIEYVCIAGRWRVYFRILTIPINASGLLSGFLNLHKYSSKCGSALNLDSSSF